MLLKSVHKIWSESWCEVCKKQVERIAVTTPIEEPFVALVIAICHGKRIVFRHDNLKSDGRNFRVMLTCSTRMEEVDHQKAVVSARTTRGKNVDVIQTEIKPERVFTFD